MLQRIVDASLENRAVVLIAAILVVGGLLGFLPVLGFWMVPLGLAVLAVDLPFVRRLRRRLIVWWGRRADRKRKDPPYWR